MGRPEHMGPYRWWALVAAVLGLALAGCIQTFPDPGEARETPTTDGSGPGTNTTEETPPETLTFSPLLYAYIINSTLDPSVLDVIWAQDLTTEECSFRDEWPTHVSYAVYDRYGKFVHEAITLEKGRRNTPLRIPLTGTPPYVFANDRNICEDTEASSIFNVTDGFWPWPDRISTIASSRLELDVERGETSDEAIWMPGPFATRFYVGIVEAANRSGHIYGTVRLYQSNGDLVCMQRFSTMGQDGECDPFYLFPGEYRIELELDHPAVLDTRWQYRVDALVFNEGVCRYGFEWEGLCS